MRGLLVFALFALASLSVSAQELRNVPPTPRDFSWQWPLTVDTEEDLGRLTLKPEVYARLWRDDVTDLVVFNGAGEVVPMSPMQDVLARASSGAGQVPLSVPLFRVPPSASGSARDRLRVVVSQRDDGRLERIDTDVAVENRKQASSGELLLDLSAISVPVRGLLVEFAPGAAPLVARVDVFGSRDLSNWTRLAAGQALVSLNEDGLKLERSRIEFAATDVPYLRLQRTDTSDALPIAQVRVLRSRSGNEEETQIEYSTLNGQAEARSRAWLYESPGPFPVEQISVTLADRNAVASVIIESRHRADLPWRERARGAVFRLAGKNGVIESAPLEITMLRDREWRVRTEPPQAKPPKLGLGFRPDQFVFLTQGEGPYRLAAGSARSQRGSFPLRAVFQQLDEERRGIALIPEARLGRGVELAGGAALAPRPDASGSPSTWQWLLWGLLLIGAFTVVTMVLKLLRQSGA